MSNGGTVRVGAIQPVVRGGVGELMDRAEAVGRVRRNVEHVVELLRRAGRERIDIACTPEDVLTVASLTRDESNRAFLRDLVAETSPWVLQRLADAARETGMYVVGCCYVPEGERMFNAAVLFDRQGREVGRYRKTHLPREEDRFFAAGTTNPVFETDFGRVGMIICWDMMFPEPMRILALEGARIVFCPTLGFDFGGEHMGEMRVRVRAFDNGVYVVIVMYAGEKERDLGRSCIVDPRGHLLADAGYLADRIIWTDVDLAKPVPDPADPQGQDGLDHRTRFIVSRRPATYRRLIQE